MYKSNIPSESQYLFCIYHSDKEIDRYDLSMYAQNNAEQKSI
jgi:hypothetical protein